MKYKPLKDPWRILAKIVEQNDPAAIVTFLKDAPPVETARAIANLGEDDRQKLLRLLNPPDAADLLQELPEAQAADLIEQLSPKDAAAIMDQISESGQADILSDVEESSANAILNAMPAEEAEKTRQILEYPEDTAGALMDTDYLSYPEGFTCQQVIEDLQANRRKYSDYHVQYAYVVSGTNALIGVLRIRDLPLSPPSQLIKNIMNTNPIRVVVDTHLTDLLQIFEEYTFLGIPVVDNRGILIGVLQRDKVQEASGERDKSSFLKASGIIGGEELRSMPLLHRAKRRLSWLSINIVLNIIAASVIAAYQETLAAVIALAVFLPIISDMSGCSGNQAVAVSIRELTLGILKPFELAGVLFKEIGIGILNGIALGSLLGLVAFIWKGNFFLGIIVGGSLAINTTVAVCLGGIIPLLLRLVRLDPALASGPILTTITDMCGFFFVLAFAKQMLPLL